MKINGWVLAAIGAVAVGVVVVVAMKRAPAPAVVGPAPAPKPHNQLADTVGQIGNLIGQGIGIFNDGHSGGLW